MRFGDSRKTPDIFCVLTDRSEHIVEAVTHEFNAFGERLVTFGQSFDPFVNPHRGDSSLSRIVNQPARFPRRVV